jgi:hypothetical protein
MQREPHVHSSPAKPRASARISKQQTVFDKKTGAALTFNKRSARVSLGVGPEGVHLILGQIVIVPPLAFRTEPALGEIV